MTPTTRERRMPSRRVGATPAQGSKSPQASTRLMPDQLAAIDQHAAATGRSRNDVIRDAVAQYLADPPGMVAPRRPYGSGSRQIVWIPAPGQGHALAAIAEAYTVAERADNPRARRVSVAAVVRRAVTVYLARLQRAATADQSLDHTPEESP